MPRRPRGPASGPLRRSSRLIIEGDRSSWPTVARTPIPARCRSAIRSRSPGPDSGTRQRASCEVPGHRSPGASDGPFVDSPRRHHRPPVAPSPATSTPRTGPACRSARSWTTHTTPHSSRSVATTPRARHRSTGRGSTTAAGRLLLEEPRRGRCRRDRGRGRLELPDGQLHYDHRPVGRFGLVEVLEAAHTFQQLAADSLGWAQRRSRQARRRDRVRRHPAAGPLSRSDHRMPDRSRLQRGTGTTLHSRAGLELPMTAAAGARLPEQPSSAASGWYRSTYGLEVLDHGREAGVVPGPAGAHWPSAPSSGASPSPTRPSRSPRSPPTSTPWSVVTTNSSPNAPAAA